MAHGERVAPAPASAFALRRTGAGRRAPGIGKDSKSPFRTQSARSASRRAQFRLWIFSYHIFGRSPNLSVSRVLFVRGDRISRSGSKSGLRFAPPGLRSLKCEAPARLPGGRNSNCGFSPSTTWRWRQKSGCQESRLSPGTVAFSRCTDHPDYGEMSAFA